MSEHLARAAKARHDDVMRRATKALQQMAQSGEAITFVAVARRAGVSTDFLYNTPTLRSKITELRGLTGGHPAATSSPPKASGASSTSAIRALSTQVKEERRRHREELEALQNALAVAHGENLRLRRQLSQLDD